MEMNDEALAALLKETVDPGDVTPPPETVSIVMRTIAVAECVKALLELYCLAPLEFLSPKSEGRPGRKED